MHKLTISLQCAALAAFSALAPAQEGAQEGAPTPAHELKKLEPLIGNWGGKGVFNEPAVGQTKWTAIGGYQWSHDGFWVREDFTITFEGMPEPMAIRAYIGWDAETQRYVSVHASNNGDVGVDELHLQEDGTMTMLAVRSMPGMAYSERANSRVAGDKMTMNIDFLMPGGPSMSIVEGSFSRIDMEAPSALACKGFGAPAEAAMAQLTRGAGVYDVKGSMTMAPGIPPMNIHGTDTFKAVFGGAVMHGHTDGAAEGMPGKYEADVFWGYDAKRRRYTTAFVSNMGEVGTMDMWFSEDGKQLISTSAGTMHGAPMAQRFVLELDDKGAFKSGVGHLLVGAAPPMESFKATYTKK